MTKTQTISYDPIKLYKAGRYFDKLGALCRVALGRSQLWLRPAGFGLNAWMEVLTMLYGKGCLASELGVASFDWDELPRTVIRVNFRGLPVCRTPEGLRSALDDRLSVALEAAGYDQSRSRWGRYLNKDISLWLQCHYKNTFGILLEDYDLPMAEYLGEPALFQAAQSWMNELTGYLDEAYLTCRAWISTGTFNFLTGNHSCSTDYKTDLSFSERAIPLSGLTQNEISRYFAVEITRTAATLGCSEEGVMKKLAVCGGYSFDGKHPNPATEGRFRTEAVEAFFAAPKAGVRPQFFRTPAEEESVTAWLKGKTLELTDGVMYVRKAVFGTPRTIDNLRLEDVSFAIGCLTLKGRLNEQLSILTIPNESAAQALARFGVNVDDRTAEERRGP